MRRRERRARAWGLGLVLLAGISAGGTAPASASAGGGALDAGHLLEGVRARMAQGAALQTPFVQISHWVVLDRPDTSLGVLTVMPPDRFRLEYEQPAGHLIGCDGSQIWTIVPEERQVLRARVGDTSGWGGLFYRGLEEAADSSVVLRESPPWGRVARIALRARPEWGLRSLYVELLPDGTLPVGYGYADDEGNRTEFWFGDPQFLDRVNAALFRFAVPTGYELFETR